MAKPPRRRLTGVLIRNAIADPTARAVLGSLSASDLEVLAQASKQGELGTIVNPILSADNPKQAARTAATVHPVAKVMSKIPNQHLTALAAACTPLGCPG